jgi:hypothetical protein
MTANPLNINTDQALTMAHTLYLYEIGTVGNLKKTLDLQYHSVASDRDVIVSYGATLDPVALEDYHIRKFGNLDGSHMVVKRMLWFDDELSFVEAEGDINEMYSDETCSTITHQEWGNGYHNLVVYNSDYYNILVAKYDVNKVTDDMFLDV